MLIVTDSPAAGPAAPALAAVLTDDTAATPPQAAAAEAAVTVSPRKLAANRANARRSTGPRTPAGKARARMNAVRHGLAAHAPLLPGEDRRALLALAGDYHADLRPRGALERDVVARIVGIAWRLRRVARAEEAMWAIRDEQVVHSAEVAAFTRTLTGYPAAPWESDEPADPQPAAPFVAAQFAQRATSPLERLAVYEQRLGRALHAAIREFQALRKLRGEDDGDEDDGAAEGPDVETPSVRTAAPLATPLAPGATEGVRETPPGDDVNGAEQPAPPAPIEIVQIEPTATPAPRSDPTDPHPPASAARPDGGFTPRAQNEPTVPPREGPGPVAAGSDVPTFVRTSECPGPETGDAGAPAGSLIEQAVQNEPTALLSGGAAPVAAGSDVPTFRGTTERPAERTGGSGAVAGRSGGTFVQNEPTAPPPPRAAACAGGMGDLWVRTPTGWCRG